MGTDRGLVLTASGIAKTFGVMAGCLVAIHGLLYAVHVAFDTQLYGIVHLFDLAGERNIPTLFACFELMACAVLLVLIAMRNGPQASISSIYWWGLAACFAFLAVDEFVGIHEQLMRPLKSTLHATGALRYTWVIPYGIGSLVIAALYIRFLLRIPRRSALLFVVAGAVFVFGALVLEMGSGWMIDYQQNGHYVFRGWPYKLVQTFEETFEMGGLVVFLYALVDYIGRGLGGLRFEIGEASVEGTKSD